MKKTIALSAALFIAAAYALVPTADELKQAEEWSAHVFGGELKELPFTFSYNGKDFRAGGWTRTKTDAGYVFREPSGTVEAMLEIRKYPGFPALSWLLRFRNVSTAKSGIISNVRNFDFLLPAVSKRKHHVVHHAAGAMQSLDDYQQFTTPVTREWWLRPQSHRLHVETTGGRACETAWPYFNIETPDAGRGMIAAIGWAGQWQADFLAQEDGKLRFTAGMNDSRFYLNPGEAVRGPRATVLFYRRGDWIEGQNIWRQWFLECNEPRLNGKVIPYQTMCSARSVGFDSDSWSSATHKEGVDAYAAHGFKIDYWWIDAAWYEWKSQWNKKGGEAHWRWTGNYDTDPVRFPKGPGEVFDYAREKLGAKDGILWFELERVVPSARVYQAHPEYFYAGNTGRGAFLNLGDPKAWEWGFKTVDSVLKREHANYFRLDFNFPPLHFWRKHDARNGEQNRVGISEMKHVEGFYRLYEAVLASNPSCRRIDNCSQGGCRNDVESLSYSAPLWRTDTSGPLDEQQMQTQGISLWVPLYGGGRPRTADVYELRSRLMPYLNVGTGLAPANVNWDNLKANYLLWEKIRRYYVKDFYPLTRSDNGSDLWCGWEFVDADDGSGFIQLFRRKHTPTTAFVVRPRGLDPAKMYVFTDVDTSENWTIPGDGSFEIRADKPCTAKVVLFKAAGDRKVPIITDAMREFLKRPKWERMGLMLDQDFRVSAKKVGSCPKPFELKVGDATEVELRALAGDVSVGSRVPRDRVRTIKVANGVAVIDNLLVGTRYTWTARRGGKTVGTGTFETEAGVPRICRIDGVGNVRDIGGYATLDGRRVKQGMLYRSAALNRQAHGRKEQPRSEWRVGESLLTDAAMKEAEATFGIRLELDLRTDWESYGMTSSPLGPSTRWVNVSSSNYDGMKTETAKAAFAKCFRELNNPANLPAIFHCAGGADRTGSLAWLLGGILGVAEDDLDKDWELTVFNYDLVKFNHWNYIDGLKRYLNEAFPKMPVQRQCVAYAKACGITDEEIARFRDMMLERPLSPGVGRAEWITGWYVVPGEDDYQAHFADAPAPVLEREFTLAAKPVKRAVWRIASPGMYDASVNGKRVNVVALPLWTAYDRRVLEDEYDVTAFVKEGRNTLAIELGNGWWNPLPMKMWGRFNLRKTLPHGTPTAKATLEVTYADGTMERIVTDRDWSALEGPVLRNNLYLGEKRDMRRRAGAGAPRQAARVVSDAPKGAVLPRGDAPPVIVYDRWKAKDVKPLPDGKWIVDMGVNFAGTIRATVKGSHDGDVVTFRYGEILYPDGKLNVMTSVCGQQKKAKIDPPGIAEQKDTVICPEAERFVYEPRFTFHGFRYVEVAGLRVAPSPEDFEALAWSADVKDSTSFECSDPKINRLRDVCRRTFRSNMQGVQSDCPARERFGYGGDLAATAESFVLNYDMSAFYRKVVRDRCDMEALHGVFSTTSPSVFPNQCVERCRFGWAVDAPIVVDLLLRYYGDRRTMREAYPFLRRFLFRCAETFDTRHVPPCIGDHEALEKADKVLTAQCHYHQFLKLTAKFARLLGETPDAEKFEATARELESAFAAAARYVPAKGFVGDGRQGEECFAIYHGMLPPEDLDAAYRILKENVAGHDYAMSTGIFSTQYILEILTARGDAEIAGRVFSHKGFPGWFNMLDNGATTLWETWAPSDNTYSHNHPMFGSCAAWLMRGILGIQVAEDAVGCDKVRIAPHAVAGVTWAKGHLDTPKGRILVSWRLENGRIKVEKQLPAGIVEL